jgi:hypothetical protein
LGLVTAFQRGDTKRDTANGAGDATNVPAPGHEEEPLMSKKHFIELARIVSRADYLSDEARARLVSDLVTFCADANPRFSSSRFREACEPTPQRYGPCAVHGGVLGTVWRVRDRETGEYVSTMPRRFQARGSAQACADNLNGR